MLEVAIEADGEWDSSTGWDRLAHGAATAAIAESAFPQLGDGERTVELSIRLGSNAEVHALNSQWRGKDRPTNVLSFPMLEADELDDASSPGPELMLGDIILAHGVCAAEAEEKAIPLE